MYVHAHVFVSTGWGEQAGDSLGGDALTDNVCTVHTLADGDFSVLVARCQYSVPTASAPLWADAVFKAVQPDRCVCCGWW